jgi:hypothetical protein
MAHDAACEAVTAQKTVTILMGQGPTEKNAKHKTLHRHAVTIMAKPVMATPVMVNDRYPLWNPLGTPARHAVTPSRRHVVTAFCAVTSVTAFCVVTPSRSSRRHGLYQNLMESPIE